MGFNTKAIIKVLSLVVIILGTVMFVPVLFSLYYGEFFASRVFLTTASSIIIIGSIIFFALRKRTGTLKTRDGILAINLVWITCVFVSAIPFCITSGVSFVDAIFESTSGFTTTGASVLTDIESFPKSLLFWRSFTNWLGGLSIIILVISVFPLVGGRGQIIISSESLRSRSDKITSKYADMAKRLFLYYVFMTAACIFLLVLSHLNMFEAINTSLSTVSTGGFSVFNDRLTGIDNTYTLIILILFMIFGSINFALYYQLFSVHWREFFRDTELRWYIFIIIAGSTLITLDTFLTGKIADLSHAIIQSLFSFVSIVSTTGFVIVNYDKWSSFAIMILFIAMFIGGCSASTAGGIKTYRVVVIYKLIKRNLSRRLHPNAVVSIRSDEGPMRADFVSSISAFVFVYIIILFTSTLILSIANQDLYTTLSAVIACLGNIGPGFDSVGPLGSYEIFPWWGKLLLCIDMLAGRLELFGFVLMATRWFWDPDKYNA